MPFQIIPYPKTKLIASLPVLATNTVEDQHASWCPTRQQTRQATHLKNPSAAWTSTPQKKSLHSKHNSIRNWDPNTFPRDLVPRDKGFTISLRINALILRMKFLGLMAGRVLSSRFRLTLCVLPSVKICVSGKMGVEANMIDSCAGWGEPAYGEN